MMIGPINLESQFRSVLDVCREEKRLYIRYLPIT